MSVTCRAWLAVKNKQNAKAKRNVLFGLCRSKRREMSFYFCRPLSEVLIQEDTPVPGGGIRTGTFPIREDLSQGTWSRLSRQLFSDRPR